MIPVRGAGVPQRRAVEHHGTQRVCKIQNTGSVATTSAAERHPGVPSLAPAAEALRDFKSRVVFAGNAGCLAFGISICQGSV